MKKLTLSLAFFASILAVAQTTFKIEANKDDYLYKCGETATFTVTAVGTNGLPVKTGSVTASLDNFGPKKIGKRSIDWARENPFQMTGSLSEPGFLR